MAMDWHTMEQDLIHQIRTGDGVGHPGMLRRAHRCCC